MASISPLRPIRSRYRVWTTDRSFPAGHWFREIVTKLAYYAGIHSPNRVDEDFELQHIQDDGTMIYWHHGLSRYFIVDLETVFGDFDESIEDVIGNSDRMVRDPESGYFHPADS